MCADEPLRPSRPGHTAVQPIGSPFSSPFGFQLTDRHAYKCSVACMMSGQQDPLSAHPLPGITHSNCCQAHWITLQLTIQLAACCMCADEPFRPSRPDHTAVKPIGTPISSPFGLQLTVNLLMSPSDHQGLITLLSGRLDHLSAHLSAGSLL
jgi:hypothetical protein